MELCHPNNRFCRTYIFESIVITNPGCTYASEENFKRTAEVHFFGKVQNCFLYQILTREYNFSNEENSMGQLLKKVSYLFDEVRILANAENKIVRVLNREELQKRWNTIQEKLLVNHGGTEIEQYCRSVHNLLRNESKLIQFLREKKMFGLYFNEIFGAYENKMKKERQIEDGFTERLFFQTENDFNIIRVTGNSDAENVSSLFYYKNNNIVEAYAEDKKYNQIIKHSLLWIG